MTWRDLSDGELRARLEQRVISAMPPIDQRIDELVRRRDDEQVAAELDEILS